MSNSKSISPDRYFCIITHRWKCDVPLRRGSNSSSASVDELLGDKLNRTLAASFWRTCSWPISVLHTYILYWLVPTGLCYFCHPTLCLHSQTVGWLSNNYCSSVSLACKGKRCRILLIIPIFWLIFVLIVSMHVLWPRHGLVYINSHVLKRVRPFNSSGIYFAGNVIDQFKLLWVTKITKFHSEIFRVNRLL